MTGPGDPSLFPSELHNPYYIVAPPYSRFSAGMKALHLLCHGLNRQGYNAFILPIPNLPPGLPATHPDLLTPRLTRDVVEFHFREGRTPIAVYPEIVAGNPLAAPVVVRYVLNFPGLLGGDREYTPSDIRFGYSRELAVAAGAPDNVLFIPTSDTRVFHPAEADGKRSGTCFYGIKYQKVHHGELLPQTRDSVEITREQTPEQLAELFRRSELLYCYENTAAALEAALCGCPAVFLPNPNLTSRIAADEVGRDGYAWGDSPDEIARAKATVGRAFANYRETQALFWRQLARFAEITQERAATTAYEAPVRMPAMPPRRGRRAAALAALAADVLWREGWDSVVRRTFGRVLRLGAGRKHSAGKAR